ncbi:RNA binding (RRM/RBD/RNP motifs) family protein [Artemisia annua]|uniref:RNA binding (RRM/RBD/RNP motifs) family protein n=1 Tax=Artemisia annua TaxID=35608 RepID=A0A2U1NGQ7_ARTAN|nr:RNA binding (RRM/RBD/RNP motifs) family protein [Artemisia annua]
MRTEAAGNALSLDGKLFMSCILKVVRNSSAQQEAAPVTTSWPPPFPRGIRSPYRSRLRIKTGARSFKWKRDTDIVVPDSVPKRVTTDGNCEEDNELDTAIELQELVPEQLDANEDTELPFVETQV